MKKTTIAAVALAVLCGASLWAQAKEKEKKVQDQGEYDIFTAASKETDVNKKLQFLQQWKDKYPNSDYKEDRQLMFCVAYQQARQGEKMWECSKELVAMNPKSLPGLFFLTSLTIGLGNTAADRLDTGEKASRGLLANLDSMPAPPGVSVEQLSREKQNYRFLALKTIGWIEMSRKAYDKAEQEFSNYLKENANSGQISYWLAQVMLLQKKGKEKQIPALFHLARAANYTGDDALPDTAKKQLQEFLRKTYVGYRGSDKGLQDVIDLAVKQPFPPEGFYIKSQQEEIAEQKEKLRNENPTLYLWIELKENLTHPTTGAEYREQIKGSALPKFKGKLISAEPANRPKELTIGILNAEVAEIKLKMEKPFTNKADPGLELEFEGAVPEEITAEPFLITATLENDKLVGWPAPPRPTPKAGKKGGAKKK